jgi:hypothetical protein
MTCSLGLSSALTDDLGNVMLAPAMLRTLPGNVEDVRARIQIFDTLQNVQNAAQEASESFELVALETLRRLGHPPHPATPETLPESGTLTRMSTLNRECSRLVVDL